MRKNKFIIVIIAVIFCLGLVFFPTTKPSHHVPRISTLVSPMSASTFSYQGDDGKNALVLLKKKTSIEQDTSGLVTTINGRKAQEQKREYWSFYVNGKMSSVGPKDYVTKGTDTIEWKIETY